METSVKYMEHIVSTKIHSGHKSCFGCIYYNGYADCTWFAVHRYERSREIPSDVFDKGCKLREPSVESGKHSEIVQKIIDVFNGEVRQEQTVRRHRPRKKRCNSLYKRK